MTASWSCHHKGRKLNIEVTLIVALRWTFVLWRHRANYGSLQLQILMRSTWQLLPPPLCQQRIWSVEKLSNLSTAKELITAKPGSECQCHDTGHRFLTPTSHQLFNGSTVSRGSLAADKRQKRELLVEGREIKAQMSQEALAGEREISPLRGEELMPRAAQMAVSTSLRVKAWRSAY